MAFYLYSFVLFPSKMSHFGANQNEQEEEGTQVGIAKLEPAQVHAFADEICPPPRLQPHQPIHPEGALIQWRHWTVEEDGTESMGTDNTCLIENNLEIFTIKLF
jgi:hypothetical protein